MHVAGGPPQCRWALPGLLKAWLDRRWRRWGLSPCSCLGRPTSSSPALRLGPTRPAPWFPDFQAWAESPHQHSEVPGLQAADAGVFWAS